MDEHKQAILHEFLSYVKIIAISLAISLLIVNYIIINARIPSGSMEDSISEGDRLIGFRLSYAFSEPKRGDVIIFKFPDDESQTFIKRIIGVPGDLIRIKEGELYINGELIHEDYIKEPMKKEDFGPYIVPPDSYFCLGDNRNDSNDARFWNNTYVTREQILAKAIFKYWHNFELIK